MFTALGALWGDFDHLWPIHAEIGKNRPTLAELDQKGVEIWQILSEVCQLWRVEFDESWADLHQSRADDFSPMLTNSTVWH